MKTEPFIIGSFKVPQTAFNYIYNQLLKDRTKEQKEFFCHVLYNSMRTLKRQEMGYVPVPYKLQEKVWKRKLNIQPLLDSKLLELKILDKETGQTYSKENKKCKRYRVPINIIFDIISYITLEVNNKSFYDLMKGRKTQQKEKCPLRKSNNYPISGLLGEILKLYRTTPGIFNLKELQLYINSYKNRLDINNHSEVCRFINDFFCFQQLLASNPKHLNGDLYEYDLVYDPQISGRITERHGKLQACSREMKKIAYSKIERVYNYDLKSSQPNILKHYFDLAGIDSKWLNNYLKTDKKDYASKIGVDINTWKTIFMATIMGAKLVDIDKISENNFKDYQIIKVLYEYFNKDVNSTKVVYKLYRSLISDLVKDIKNLLIWFDNDYKEKNLYKFKKKVYIKNACGMLFELRENCNYNNKYYNEMIAFILQGKEAEFIHNLTIACNLDGVRIISNMHDGLVTLDEIPEEAVRYAIDATGFKYAQLELKDL